ncbi:MAG: LysM peptidoglycan-binding domain-containing protein [Bacteroidales bacterium]|nr:LysM peptidoglycan-binding domain-containing protein [Bacteroidales bacterium]
MDIYQLIQLFKRHILLLIIVPLVLAFTVYMFTRNKKKNYTSQTVVYTGIATGYSIETTGTRTLDYFGTNMQFDNMINMLKSRQTLEQTAITLFSQDLSLEKYNSQYISERNYFALQDIVPKLVKDLVVKNGKTGYQREKEQEINYLEDEIKGLEREISKKKNKAKRERGVNYSEDTNIKKDEYLGLEKMTSNNKVNENTDNNIYHIVQAGETFGQLSSRYGKSIGELMNINHLQSTSLSPGQQLIVGQYNDFNNNNSKNYITYSVKAGETLFSIANKFKITVDELKNLNNITTQSLPVGTMLKIKQDFNNYQETPTYEKTPELNGKEINSEVGGKKTSSVQKDITSAEIVEDISKYSEQQSFVKDPIIPPGIKPEDFDQTIKNFTLYYLSSDSNFIYQLLHYTHHHYSIAAIQNVEVFRVQNSDLIRISYTSDDPGICQQTLKILTQAFIENYKLLKETQTDAVVKYFEEQVRLANERLNDAENRLLKFNQKNNIINYYEQSKYIAATKEDLDVFYQNEQIRLESASAALDEIERGLANRDNIYLKSQEIADKRDQLQKIAERILIAEIDDDENPMLGSKLANLHKQSNALKDELQIYTNQLYLYTHTTQGIPIKTLLNEWLENVISYEEAKASLKVLAKRKNDFLVTYRIFAPLGAMLTRIEREISVAEQSYLELLHSLNLAKMRQQNLEMSSNLKVVDEPYFPITPNSTKTKLLIIVAALFGFILVAALILILEYFDTTIKTPERAEKLTKLRLAGAYPKISPKNDTIDFGFIENRLIEIIGQNIKLKINQNLVYSMEKPYLILIFSTKNDVGKTLLTKKIINKFASYGEKVLYLNYSYDNTDNQIDEANDNYLFYKIRNNFSEIKDFNELINTKYLRQRNFEYDYIFVEIPAIIYHTYPLELMKSFDISILCVKANHRWQKADIMALDTMKEVSGDDPIVILNQTELFVLETIINGIPSNKKKNKYKNIKKYFSFSNSKKNKNKLT